MNWCNWWPLKRAAEEPKVPPLCRDCRHMMPEKKWLEQPLNDPENAIRFSRCERTIHSIRYVGWNGEAWDQAIHCGNERLDGKCGKQGKFWAPKEN